MKFSNGCWLMGKGSASFSPKQICFPHVEETRVTFCTPTYPVRGRGDTMNGVNLSLEVTSPLPDVIRVRVWHYKGRRETGPAFALQKTVPLPLSVTETEDELCVTSGALTLRLGRKDWGMSYERDGRVLTRSGAKDLAMMKMGWQGSAYDDAGDGADTFLRQQFSLAVGEHIYGLGERFGALVKNGQSVEIWNEDGGTSTQQAYKNIPFYLSDKGYGVFVNHPERVSFEIASETVTRAAFSVEGGFLDYFFVGGASMKDTLRLYTDLTGKPGLPAPWTFGLWLSTSFTTDYDEQTVMRFIDGMLERNIPLRTFHFDCFWMKEFHWTDFVWDERVFPDPAGLLRRIHQKGLNVCVWINPYIAQESVLFEEGRENGYLVRRPDGSVWQWDMWQPGMALVDFTNPDAAGWYQGHLARLLDMGVDCFKTDFGERIPTDVVYFDGADPQKMHNYYTYLYNRCVYELLEEKRGKGNAVLFARSATAGCQQFPVHWGGDCWADYESMEESLRGGLSLLMSGFGFWAHDIGGFEETSTADVYKRWVAFGLLSSHSRLHGSSSYRVPWLYDEEAVDVVRFFTRLKASLMPYLYAAAVTAHQTGIPVMRAMVLEFPDDHNCSYLDKQYLLGDALLVAPVFNAESMADYYLPEGRWTDFFTGQEVSGGRWIRETCSYLRIPLLVREHSILALGNRDDRPDYDYADHVELRVYALREGEAAQAVVYRDREEEAVQASVQKMGGAVSFSVRSDAPFTIRFVGVQAVSAAASAAPGAPALPFRTEGRDTVLENVREGVLTL